MANVMDPGDETGESWNIVPSMSEQGDTFNALVSSMAQSNLTQTPALPEQAPGIMDSIFSGKSSAPNPLQTVNNNIVTRAIANQGQLLPIPNQQSGANATATAGDLKKLLGAIQASNTQAQSTASTAAAGKSSSSGGGGGIIGDLASVATAFLSWVICTELYRQGKMPIRLYIKGGPIFASYSEIGKRGYYIWAIPCVHHLRNSPNDWFSRFLSIIFLWRAEFIARPKLKNWKGAIVSAILYPSCHILGYILWIFGRKFDWMLEIYGVET